MNYFKLENLLLTYSPHAILVVMAVDQSDSFQLAEHILLYLSHNGYMENKVRKVEMEMIQYLSISQAVILVANKADLVRNREIKTNTAKQLAVKYGVKYIETSPGTRLQ